MSERVSPMAYSQSCTQKNRLLRELDPPHFSRITSLINGSTLVRILLVFFITSWTPRATLLVQGRARRDGYPSTSCPVGSPHPSPESRGPSHPFRLPTWTPRETISTVTTNRTFVCERFCQDGCLGTFHLLPPSTVHLRRDSSSRGPESTTNLKSHLFPLLRAPKTQN